MKIGLIGTGKMGESIFKLIEKKYDDITVLAIDAQEASTCRKRYFKKSERALKRGKITPDELQRLQEKIRFTHQMSDLSDREFVLEIVFEKYDVKRELFTQLETVVSADAILATNTSSCSVNRLAGHLKHKHRFCGMHFFHPVAVMNLIEILSGDETHEKTVDIIRGICSRIGKKSIVLKDCPGSGINNILSHYFVEGFYILEEGVFLPSQIDRIAKNYFFAGPCESIDNVGIDFLINALKIVSDMGGRPILSIDGSQGSFLDNPAMPFEMPNNVGGREGFFFPRVCYRLIKDKRFGRRGGKGIYLYEKDRPRDDEQAYYAQHETSQGFTRDDNVISQRLLYSLFNGFLYELWGMNAHVDDLDLGVKEVLMMKDGPATMMRKIGKQKVLNTFNALASSVGPRFQPHALDLVFSD